jgi:hypothetical protein
MDRESLATGSGRVLGSATVSRSANLPTDGLPAEGALEPLSPGGRALGAEIHGGQV